MLSKEELAKLEENGCHYPWSARDMLRLIGRKDKADEPTSCEDVSGSLEGCNREKVTKGRCTCGEAEGGMADSVPETQGQDPSMAEE